MASSDEIKTLQRMSQRAAAFLVGVSVRTLRKYDVPRRTDGSYDAREVMRWMCSRVVSARESRTRSHVPASFYLEGLTNV